MYRCFETIAACDGQTDGRADRWTPCHSTVRAVHTRRSVTVDNFCRRQWHTEER